MSERITELMLGKYINEEIMTKGELDRRLDAVMAKYTRHMDDKFALIDIKFDLIDKRFEAIDRRFEAIDARFEAIDKKFDKIDIRYNWIIGTVLSVGVALTGVIFACSSFITNVHG